SARLASTSGRGSTVTARSSSTSCAVDPSGVAGGARPGAAEARGPRLPVLGERALGAPRGGRRVARALRARRPPAARDRPRRDPLRRRRPRQAPADGLPRLLRRARTARRARARRRLRQGRAGARPRRAGRRPRRRRRREPALPRVRARAVGASERRVRRGGRADLAAGGAVRRRRALERARARRAPRRAAAGARRVGSSRPTAAPRAGADAPLARAAPPRARPRAPQRPAALRRVHGRGPRRRVPGGRARADRARPRLGRDLGGDARPLISVLLPVRDGAAFLHEALESVLGQTLADFELLVVDDGSEDETPAILAAVADERVRVLRQERLGLVAALGRAIAAARAPLLARMDADDVSLPERLERHGAHLEERPRGGLGVT